MLLTIILNVMNMILEKSEYSFLFTWSRRYCRAKGKI